MGTVQKDVVPLVGTTSDAADEDGTLVPNSGVKVSLPDTGTLLGGRYLLEERIGAGAAAVVHRATDTKLKTPVAIKVLKQESLNAQAAASGIGVNLRNEAIAAMRLSHPHILRVFNYESDGNFEFLVMEHIEGEDSRKQRERSLGGCLPLDQMVRIGSQCLHALQYAHGLDVVHHDIKPSNILLTPSGDAKLCDFGLARLSTGQWKRGIVAGTPGFLSPERLVGQAGDHRSDLFSMGATLYALANGKSPFGTDPVRIHMALTEGELPPPGHLPPVLFQVIAGSLARQPADRFKDAGEMRAALSQAWEVVKDALPVAVRPVPAPPPPTPGVLKPPTAGAPIRDAQPSTEGECLDVEISVVAVETPTAAAPVEEIGVVAPLGAFSGGDETGSGAAGDHVSIGSAVSHLPDGMVTVAAWSFKSYYTGKQVKVGAFAMDALPVTNADYGRFVEDEAYTPPHHWNGWEPPPDRHDHPVVGITFEDARAYAEWAGKRLPTSLEWESACRHADARIFPWGNQWDPRLCHCREGGALDTCAVGSYPDGASRPGCLGLVGNVWEWTSRVPSDVPDDPDMVWVYGGSYRHSCHTSSGVARNAVSAGNDYDYLGFRCALRLSP